MPSVSFDPVAHVYDATRGYPEQVAVQIAQTLAREAQAMPGTAFLEVGVGTGRIMLPLASLGYTCTGVDISEKMLGQLEVKLRSAGWQQSEADEQPWGRLADEDTTTVAAVPAVRRFRQHEGTGNLRLVSANMCQLPFRDASFDVVIAVHVFHLVQDWQQAVKEVLRVLRPGGMLLHCGDIYGTSGEGQMDDMERINKEWQQILQALGGDLPQRPGVTSHKDVITFLEKRGLQTVEECALTWEEARQPRKIIQAIAERAWSSSWAIPDSIFVPAVERLWQWGEEYYGAEMDSERKVERRFMISKTRV